MYLEPSKFNATVIIGTMHHPVPLILKDALQVTSQSIEGEMAKTLKMAYQLTGLSSVKKHQATNKTFIWKVQFL